jgi:hypothetical protein
MLIANPIYDVVFKYLMEDSRVAKLLISSIIGQEIESIELRPQEISITADNIHNHTVYRMDFSAQVRTEEGLQTIIVEVQKAKRPGDIIRFRRYLAKQYSSSENTYKLEKDKHTKGIPIVSIYFLGYSLDKIDAPVLKVKRVYTDVATQEVYDTKDDFIECLTHDSYVIQTSHLKKKRRNELEALLTVFDPENLTKDEHIMSVNEDDFPEKYRPLIRRLQSAVETEFVREAMHIEDEILNELGEMARTIADERQAREKAEKQKQEAEKQKQEADKYRLEAEKKLEEAEKIIAEYRKKLDLNHPIG